MTRRDHGEYIRFAAGVSSLSTTLQRRFEHLRIRAERNKFDGLPQYDVSLLGFYEVHPQGHIQEGYE